TTRHSPFPCFFPKRFKLSDEVWPRNSFRKFGDKIRPQNLGKEVRHKTRARKSATKLGQEPRARKPVTKLDHKTRRRKHKEQGSAHPPALLAIVKVPPISPYRKPLSCHQSGTIRTAPFAALVVIAAYALSAALTLRSRGAAVFHPFSSWTLRRRANSSSSTSRWIRRLGMSM